MAFNFISAANGIAYTAALNVVSITADGIVTVDNGGTSLLTLGCSRGHAVVIAGTPGGLNDGTYNLKACTDPAEIKIASGRVVQGVGGTVTLFDRRVVVQTTDEPTVTNEQLLTNFPDYCEVRRLGNSDPNFVDSMLLTVITDLQMSVNTGVQTQRNLENAHIFACQPAASNSIARCFRSRRLGGTAAVSAIPVTERYGRKVTLSVDGVTPKDLLTDRGCALIGYAPQADTKQTDYYGSFVKPNTAGSITFTAANYQNVMIEGQLQNAAVIASPVTGGGAVPRGVRRLTLSQARHVQTGAWLASALVEDVVITNDSLGAQVITTGNDQAWTDFAVETAATKYSVGSVQRIRMIDPVFRETIVSIFGASAFRANGNRTFSINYRVAIIVNTYNAATKTFAPVAGATVRLRARSFYATTAFSAANRQTQDDANFAGTTAPNGVYGPWTTDAQGRIGSTPLQLTYEDERDRWEPTSTTGLPIEPNAVSWEITIDAAGYRPIVLTRRFERPTELVVVLEKTGTANAGVGL